MKKLLVCIVAAVSDCFRLPDPPVHSVYPRQGPAVSLEILQAQLGSSGWRETSSALLLAYPASSVWKKGSPMLLLACQCPPSYWKTHLCLPLPVEILWVEGGVAKTPANPLRSAGWAILTHTLTYLLRSSGSDRIANAPNGAVVHQVLGKAQWIFVLLISLNLTEFMFL